MAGVITPPTDEIGLLVPLIPVLNTPPGGLAIMVYGRETSHKGGTKEIVGVGGLMAVTLIVLVMGQFTILGVTITE